MRRIIPAILLFTFLLLLCSCGKEDMTVSTQKETTSQSVETVTNDEITLNYSDADEKEDTSRAIQSSATTSSQTSSQTKATTSPVNKTDSTTSSKGSIHPFDQDGDGYIDGWY